jgi:leucyl-tRNA synthetase
VLAVVPLPDARVLAAVVGIAAKLSYAELPAARPGRGGFVHCDHEYPNFRGGKFSKSRGAFVDVPYFLSRYDPDPLRYYLTATAPETRDTE